MKRFFWKIYLAWHGYCAKHLIEKDLAVGYCLDSMNFYCPECERESNAKIANRIATAKSILEHKP